MQVAAQQRFRDSGQGGGQQRDRQDLHEGCHLGQVEDTGYGGRAEDGPGGQEAAQNHRDQEGGAGDFAGVRQVNQRLGDTGIGNGLRIGHQDQRQRHQSVLLGRQQPGQHDDGDEHEHLAGHEGQSLPYRSTGAGLGEFPGRVLHAGELRRCGSRVSWLMAMRSSSRYSCVTTSQVRTAASPDPRCSVRGAAR